MAHKRKSGKRDKSGRLLRPSTRKARSKHDYGNDKVQARAREFAVFEGGKATFELHDAAGRAWAAGLFDGLGADPVALRDAAREYGNLYWSWYVDLLPKQANLDRSPKSQSSAMPEATARERRFQKMDDVLGSCASPIRQAVHALAVDYWGSEEVNPWLQRLINGRRLCVGAGVAGKLPDAADEAKWAKCCEGLLDIVRGQQRRAA